MVKPYVMTIDEVKTYLGIGDTSYDTQITTYLPVATDDLTRKNGICNQSFLFVGTADIDATNILSNVNLKSSEWDKLYENSVVRINKEDHYIAAYDEEAKTITLDSVTTATATDEDLEIRNFPLGAKPIVAQMILFKIQEGSIDGATFGKELASKSIGRVSVSFRDTSSNNNVSKDRFGYPSELTANLSAIKRPRFY